ncbi:MAG: winged helix-turn-helix domain-containing protein [Myxococcota bacterium]
MTALPLTAGVVDLARGRVDRHGGGSIALTTTERALLAYLVAHPSRDLPRTELLAQVWGYAPSVSTRTLDTTIKVLRRKIEVDPRLPDHVLTVWGVGYRFEPLPAPVDADLIGRDGALAELGRALRDRVRLLTLVGPGGVGKTRLALELGRIHGPAVFVDLSAATTADDVVQAVALALPDPERRPVIHRLADRRLVVLDNVEQVLEGVRAVALPWLALAPTLQLVLTSRSATGDPRERVIEVDPLPPAAATALLRRRTTQSRRAPVAEDDPLLERVAATTDGLPLAIELVASRAAVLGMEEILARGPRLLADPAEGGPDGRHGSVLAAVRWSLDLLDGASREVLRACAAFCGPFVADDVQAVLGDVDVTPALERLLHASLLSRHHDGRSLHLLPLVRWATLAAVDAPPALTERYVAHVLARAALARDPARAVAPDLRGILDSHHLPPASVARAGLLLSGVVLREAGAYPADDVRTIRAAAEASGDPLLRADAQLLVCAAALRRGQWDRSEFDAGLALARQTGDPSRIAWALGHLGALERLQGDAAAAVRWLTEALAVAGPDGAPDRMVTLSIELGLARRATHDPLGAIDALDAALPFAARAGDPLAQQGLMHRLGGTLLHVGRVEAARLWLTRALEVAERAGMATARFEIRGSLAYLALERGDTEAAHAGLTWCLAHTDLAMPFHLVVLHAQLALLAAETGAFSRAAELASIALGHAERRPGAPPQALAHLADGVWRAFVEDPGAHAAFTRAIAADPAGDQALFALGYRALVTADGGRDDRDEVERRVAAAASPASRAFADALRLTGRAGEAAPERSSGDWLHARLVARLRQRPGR